MRTRRRPRPARGEKEGLVKAQSIVSLTAGVTAAVLALAAAAQTPAIVQTLAPVRTPPGRARLHLIFTNDVHGHVAPEGATFMNPNFPPPLGGGASAKAYVDKVRAQIAGDPNVGLVLLD